MEVPSFLRKILRIGGKMINFADEFINIIRKVWKKESNDASSILKKAIQDYGNASVSKASP